MAEHPVPHPDLGGYVVGGLTAAEGEAFEAHAAGCDDCRREVDELSVLPGLVARTGAPIEVPAGLEERTFAAIEMAAAEVGSPIPTSPPAHPHRRRPRRMVELRKAAALVVAVALLAGGIGVATQDEPARVAAPPPTTAVPTTVTTVPAGQLLVLQPPAGRAGRGTARISTTLAGRVIDLEVEDLPVPPPGSFYECWLISAQGDSIERPNRVSVGTFTVDPTGRAKVRWNFEADTAKFPQMGITLEPSDGDLAQTNDRALRATQLIS